MAKQRETALSKKCIEYIEYLQEQGLPVFYEHRSGAGGFNYKKGIPDIYVVINGIHIELEMKTVDGKLSTMQENFKKRCERFYRIPYCTPRSLDEFKLFLDNYIKKE